MPISLTCAKCSKSLRLADTLAGKAIKCPQCATVLRVPGAAAPPPPKPAPAAVTEEEDDNIKPAPGAARTKVAAPSARKADARDDGDYKSAPAPRTPEDGEVPEGLREMVREELTTGEKLVWLGQPDAHLVFLKYLGMSGVACLILLFLTGMAVRSLVQSTRKVEAQNVILLVFGVGGMVLAAATPFFQRWKAKKSCYALTSRRAIVFDRNVIGVAKMTNYNPADLAGMRRRDWWFFQDAGDVIFKTKVTITVTDHYARGGGYGRGRGRGYRGGIGGYRGSSVSKTVTHYGFLSVRRPREVEQMIRETLVDPLLDKMNA